LVNRRLKFDVDIAQIVILDKSRSILLRHIRANLTLLRFMILTEGMQ